MKTLLRSLTAKYVVLGLFVLLLVAAVQILSFWLIHQIKDDARRINLTGKGRMLGFEVAWQLGKAAQETGEARKKTLDYLRKERAELEELWLALRDGSREYPPLPPQDESFARLNRLIEQWHSRMAPMLDQAVAGSPSAVEAFNSAIHGYVDEIDALARRLEQKYQEDLALYERLQLKSRLRLALERREFRLHYQPRVDLRTGRVTGMEALVRWERPESGTVSPAEFIPVLEETGLILPVGEWILRAACEQNKAWQEAGIPFIPMAVNLSARQLKQRDFADVLTRVLEETGLNPRHLELELTESLLMEHSEETLALIRCMDGMGVRLMIDDFGTGYSSLSYLKRMPVHALKIDRSFVREITSSPDDAAIARTIIAMAASLKMRVVAEGVETEGQLAFLRRERCDEMQGYLFSPPLPAAEADRLLREGRSLRVEEMEPLGPERTLLIVDDEEGIRTLLTQMLSGNGYRILTTGSPREAFDLLARHEVGVILADQRMPGIELLSRVKELYPHIVRMMLTAHADQPTILEAVNKGWVFKYLIKPWENEELRAQVLKAFRLYEQSGQEAGAVRS